MPKCRCSVTGKPFETPNDVWTKCPHCGVVFNVQTGQQFGKPMITAKKETKYEALNRND